MDCRPEPFKTGITVGILVAETRIEMKKGGQQMPASFRSFIRVALFDPAFWFS